jgi:predicted O-methyltransferase YrrM
MLSSIVARVREVLLSAPDTPAAPDPAVSRMANESLPPMLSRVLPNGRDVFEIAPQMGRLLANLILCDGRRRVLEFGAGASSEVISTALTETGNGAGMLTSIEANPAWCRERWSAVEATGIDAVLVPAPLRFSVSSLAACFAQPDALPALRARAPFDLLIVDAPDGLHGRTGTLHLAAPWLAPGALIVVDDVARPLMQGMLAGWLRIYRGLSLLWSDPGFAGRGAAVLCWHHGATHRSPRAWLTSIYETLSLRRRRQGR